MNTNLAGLVVLASLLPALATAQPASTKTTGAVSAASAAVSYSREKPSDACTTAAQSEWLTQDEMKLLAEHRGYRIKTFKLAKGNCYEVYGFDKDGRIVEAYFNPVTSKLVRQNVAK